MNNTHKTDFVSHVGRVSPQGVTRQMEQAAHIDDVGLRCANPTYGALQTTHFQQVRDAVIAMLRGEAA